MRIGGIRLISKTGNRGTDLTKKRAFLQIWIQHSNQILVCHMHKSCDLLTLLAEKKMEEEPNTYVYHEFKAPKGEVVTASESERRYKKGWTDNPGNFGKGFRSKATRAWLALIAYRPHAKIGGFIKLLIAVAVTAAVAAYVTAKVKTYQNEKEKERLELLQRTKQQQQKEAQPNTQK